MSGHPRRMGRPTKKPKAGERIPLGLRVTATVKHRLDKAAEASGRSQSQEAEIRLEQSFIEFNDPEQRHMAHAWTWQFIEGAEFGRHMHPEEKDRRRTDPTTWIYRSGVVRLVQSLMTSVPREHRYDLWRAIEMAVGTDAANDAIKAKGETK